MRNRLPILLLGLLATGCADGFETDPADLPTVAVFSIGEADVPIPNDLLFVDSEDGTLNLPVDDELDQSDRSSPSTPSMAGRPAHPSP